VLERLHAELADEQGLLAEALVPEREHPGRSVFGGLLEAVPPPDDRREQGLVLESVLEGYLLHHARGRLIATDDPDLRLLAGDYLYAIGLDRLARLGDIAAVRELADLISLCARVHSPGGAPHSADAQWRVARALWAGAAIAIAGGSWRAHGAVKELARAGSAPPEQVLGVTRERAATLGIGPSLEQALIAFDEAVKVGGRTT
jgi:hypothetical protein